MGKPIKSPIKSPIPYYDAEVTGYLNGNRKYYENVIDKTERNVERIMPYNMLSHYKHMAVDKTLDSISDQKGKPGMEDHPGNCAGQTLGLRCSDILDMWERKGKPTQVPAKITANDDGDGEEIDVNLFPDEAIAIDDSIVKKQFMYTVDKALDILSEEFPDEVWAKRLDLDGYSEAKIAESMGIPSWKVKNLLHKFLKICPLLKNELNKLGFTDLEISQILELV